MTMHAVSKQEAAARIRAVFVESLGLNVAASELAGVEKLDEIAGVDSLAALEFVAALEKEFGFELEPERLTLAFLTDLPALTEYLSHRSESIQRSRETNG